MKKVFTFLATMILAAQAYGLQISMTPNVEEIYYPATDVERGVSVTLGKYLLAESDEYGVFVRVNICDDSGESNCRRDRHSVFFAPENGKIMKDDNELVFVSDDGEAIALAKKSFWGWKAYSHVNLQYDAWVSGRITYVKAWIEIAE